MARGTSGASYRQILDVADWDRSVVTNAPGESGDPQSKHYRDLLEDWACGAVSSAAVFAKGGGGGDWRRGSCWSQNTKSLECEKRSIYNERVQILDGTVVRDQILAGLKPRIAAAEAAARPGGGSGGPQSGFRDLRPQKDQGLRRARHLQRKNHAARNDHHRGAARHHRRV